MLVIDTSSEPGFTAHSMGCGSKHGAWRSGNDVSIVRYEQIRQNDNAFIRADEEVCSVLCLVHRGFYQLSGVCGRLTGIQQVPLLVPVCETSTFRAPNFTAFAKGVDVHKHTNHNASKSTS